MSLALFIDYDATITDVDTFDVLVRHCAGPQIWGEFEDRLHCNAMTLRDVLAREAAMVTLSLDDADAFLERNTRFDPQFANFVEAAERHGAELTIVSSGVQPLIERALARNGLSRVRALANDVRADAAGWTMLFRDDSENGHDKRSAVVAAHREGKSTVYIGDGFSDYDAALAADRRFAKKGRALEQYLRDRDVPFVSFVHFDEVRRALFP